MSFRYRFALLFSLSVFAILTISALYIVILNEDFRQDEFYGRLQQEANESSELFFRTGVSRDEAIKELNLNVDNSLIEEEMMILSSSQQPVYATAEAAKITAPAIAFEKAKEKGLHRFKKDQLEAVVVYLPNPTPHYVVVSAMDKYGRNKAKNLRFILLVSVLGGLVLSAVLAFFYVRQIIKPLESLQQQMQRINEQNLTERVVITNNADELTQIAKNFNDMLDRLEHAFETRKSFVQHASHELRTPLANMLSQTEAALHQELPVQEYRKIFQSLKEDQQEMISLTNSLLLLSQYENLTHLDARNVMRIDELLYETIEITKAVFRSTVITVDFASVPEDEEVLVVKGNELLVKSAIQNLIRNACKYSDNDKVDITIDAKQTRITLTFENTGRQLSPTERSKLFIPFFRGENSTNTKGFGLGLSIVQRILLLHHATVSYEPVDEDVNRFVVNFPKAE